MEEIRMPSAKDLVVVMIPMDQIVAANFRSRKRQKFNDNIRSIRDVGLYKPILVNRRNFERIGKYELICGEGRLLAYRQLGRQEIDAYVWDVPETTAFIMTLGENMTRTPPEAIETARRLKQMHDEGMSIKQLSTITGKSETYIHSYIRLMEQGEERLIKGVESGAFPLSFATNVAQSNGRSVQHLLMDAFDNGIVHSKNLGCVRSIIEARLEHGKGLTAQQQSSNKYTVTGLVGDIRRITREKRGFVHQAGQKENRLFRLLTALRQLQEDKEFLSLLESEELAKPPQLKGQYEL